MVLKPGCRVQFSLMQFKKTISFLLTASAFFLPVSVRAISQSNSILDKNSISTLDTTKWRLIEAPETFQHLASVYYGTASWYGPGFYANLTASGEVYRPGTYTVAHRYLPMGTRVRVTNLSNGRSVIARVNDRGPYVGGRIVDLAHGTASALGVISTGLAEVKLEVLK